MTRGQRAVYEKAGIPVPKDPPKDWKWYGPWDWVREECGTMCRYRCPWCREEGFRLGVRMELRDHREDCSKRALAEGEGPDPTRIAAVAAGTQQAGPPSQPRPIRSSSPAETFLLIADLTPIVADLHDGGMVVIEVVFDLLHHPREVEDGREEGQEKSVEHSASEAACLIAHLIDR